MKKCPDCQRELDKYGIACQYCGKVEEAREQDESPDKEKKQKGSKPRGWKVN